MILVIGTAIAFLLWKSDAKVLDETNGLPTPQPLVRRQSAKAAVVFIHGWKGDDSSWQQFPKLATQDDRLQEADIYIVNYPTYMIKRNSSVGGLANWLWQDFFTGTLIPKYSEIHIIAHSMGGLIGRRLYLSEHISRQSGPSPLKIRSLISIASPFQGANIASLAQALGISQELVSDMEPRSHFLSDTAGQWSFLKEKPVTYCFTSPQDNIVDQWSAKGQCECPFDYPQWGHIDMVKPTDTTDARYRNPIRALISALGADLDALRKENHNFCF
jgi:pimeloyl-ACP methyl ester carboxylesterase